MCAVGSWVICETRGWLLMTLEDYAGVTLRSYCIIWDDGWSFRYSHGPAITEFGAWVRRSLSDAVGNFSVPRSAHCAHAQSG